MQNINFKSLILMETEDWIILNKPSGMITESNPFEKSLQDHLFDYLKRVKKKPIVGVVHRLDKVTSGIIIFAKKKSILKVLNRMIEERKIKKSYQAIVYNKPEKDSDTLINHLEKDPKSKRAIIHSEKTKNSKEAKLKYSLHKKSSYGYLLKIDLYTGRFHQIRAQLSNINSPITGDHSYGGKRFDTIPSNSILLHACKLQFPENTIGLPKSISSEIELPIEQG